MLNELINVGNVKVFFGGLVSGVLGMVSVLLSWVDAIAIGPVQNVGAVKECGFFTTWCEIMSLPIVPLHDNIKFIPPSPANDATCKISP